MSTPERRPGQTSWARRQQQQHESPFSRARRERLRLDALSPPRESPAQHRPSFSQTGTLAGAFAHTVSRLPLTEIEDDLFLPEYARRGSPRKRGRSTSAMPARSNPPELEDAYRQIEDAISLTDIDPSDDENFVYMASKDKLSKRIPATAARREHRLSTASESSFATESPRRQSDFTKDEERLKRATSSRSPVLDRAALGGGPSSEHLQRRGSEGHSTSEEDYGIEPPVNAPSTWGSRAKPGSAWMKSLTRNHERASTMEEPGETSTRLWGEVSPKRAQRATKSQEEIAEDPVRSRYELPPPPPAPTSSERKMEPLNGGHRIPNTPISVFPSSTFTKRSPTKRDSHDLIRKLSRTGSPGQKETEATQTPEQTTTGRYMYDKTPVAPGGWVDTPMTQRAPASQPVIKALGSKLDSAWSLERLVEEASNKKEDASTLIPNFDPLKVVKEKPPVEQPKDGTKEQPREEQIKETFELEHVEEKQPQQKVEPTPNLSTHSALEIKDLKPVELPLPDHPKSALETVLQEHKNNKDSLDVGDDTIESLQALVDLQPSEDTETQAKDDAAYEQKVMDELESDQSSEMKDFERIEGKLQSLSDNMSHLKSGLNQLESRISQDTEQIIASINKNPVEVTEGPMRSQDSCGTCRRRRTFEVVHQCIPLPHLWDRGRVRWMPRPTRLGWCILIPLAWYILENTMCDEFCHPLVAETCEGYCLEPDAPRYPFVIPTMLWRWLRLSDILAPCWAILVALSRIFSQLLGLSDGYVDDVEHPRINLSGKVWINGTRMEDIPPLETSTKGFTPLVAQFEWEKTTHIPEPMPETTSDPSSGNENWEDISMDEDEFL
ncbi:hypothetical protein BDW71DRAFT_183649 [Aspergillus fruticulosus]